MSLSFKMLKISIRGCISRTQSVSLLKIWLFWSVLLRARQCMILATDVSWMVLQRRTEITNRRMWLGRSNTRWKRSSRMIEESSPEEKTLIFCQFRGEMDYIQREHGETQLSSIQDRRFGGKGGEGQADRSDRVQKAHMVVLCLSFKSNLGVRVSILQEATRVYITAPILESCHGAYKLLVGRIVQVRLKRYHVKKLIYKETVYRSLSVSKRR